MQRLQDGRADHGIRIRVRLFLRPTAGHRLGLAKPTLDIIDVRYRPLKALIAVALSFVLSSAWSGSGQISASAPSNAESGRIQNIAPEEMWKRVTQCVFPVYSGLALDSGI